MLNRDLPTGYTSLATLNLMQQRWLKVGLSLASLVLILPVSLVLFYLTQWLRPAVLTVWTAAPPVDVPPDGFSFLIPISRILKGDIVLAGCDCVHLGEKWDTLRQEAGIVRKNIAAPEAEHRRTRVSILFFGRAGGGSTHNNEFDADNIEDQPVGRLVHDLQAQDVGVECAGLI
jgi:hypothetical protein